MKNVFILAVIVSIMYPVAAFAEMDTITCMSLKEKYADCLKSQGWQRSIWYDIFGGLLTENSSKDATKISRETLSICNSLSLTLKEERCP